MYRTFFYLFFGIFLITLHIASCSKNPMVPPDPAGLSGQPSVSAAQSPHYCAGLFGLIVDTENWTVDSVPLRTAELHLNLVSVLNTTMGMSAAGVPSEADPANGLFVLDITLTHPFPSKPQLAGFDVKGILMTAGSEEVNGMVFPSPTETHLENPDGITRWWNPSEFGTPGMFGYVQGKFTKTPASALTATANGYKYFADILGPIDSMSWVTGADIYADNGRGVFTAGSSNTRRYYIRFEMDPGPQVIFGYAIDAAWKVPSPNPPLEIPDDFPMDANQPEPFYVQCQPVANTLFYDTDTSTGGGMVRFQVNVHDWQGQALGDIAAQINSVTLFIPDLSPNTYTGTFWNETPIKARYSVDVTDIVPAELGTYPVYCFVESSDGSTYEQTMAYAPEKPLTAFTTTTVEITELPDCLVDDNNKFTEGPEIALDGQATGSVCLDDDQYDCFSFTIPEGYNASGSIGFYASIPYTLLHLFNPSYWEITYIEADPGYAEFDLNLLHLGAGTYYLQVEAYDYVTGPYFIDMNIELTQKTDTITLTEVTPDLFSMYPERCFVDSDIAYFIGRTAAWAFDVTYKTAPVLLGQCHFNRDLDVRGAAIRNGRLYFSYYNTDFSVLNYVDFTNPSNPVLHDNLFALPGYTLDMAMDSSYLYVCSSQAVVFYDYSSPTAPVQVSTIDFAPNNANYIEIMDPDGANAHLVVAGDHALISYDITDPLSPVIEGEYPTPASSYFRSITVRDNFIYINIDGNTDSTLFIYEQLADDILYRSEIAFTDYTNFFAVSDKYALIPHSDILEIFNISDKSSPTVEGSVAQPGDIEDMTVDEAGDYVFFCLLDKGFEIDDISTYPLANLFTSSVLNQPENFLAFSNGPNDYLAALDAGEYSSKTIRTAVITDPASASLIDDYFLSGGSNRKMGCGSDVLAVSSGGHDFKLLSVADPNNLTSLYDGVVTGSPHSFGFYQDYLYVANFFSGGDTLEIYDITVPAAPVFVGTFNLADQISEMAFVPDYMYAIQNYELFIYVISDPENPSFVDSIIPPDDLRGIEIAGDFLYFLTETGLEVYDISTPSAPALLGSVVLYSQGLNRFFDVVENDYAFIGDNGSEPLLIVDVTDPANPHAVMTFDCYTNNINQIQAYNGYLYISVTYDGIRIYSIDY